MDIHSSNRTRLPPLSENSSPVPPCPSSPQTNLTPLARSHFQITNLTHDRQLRATMQSQHSHSQSQQGSENAGKEKGAGVTLSSTLISRLVERAGHRDVAEVPSLKIQRSNIRSVGNAFFRFRSLHTLVSFRGICMGVLLYG